uniref:Uncharacterized protein n=1 Tax=Anguilla anguilla TaxID=7936 RepID=A0A0E9SA17_ANGAN
MFGSTCQRVIPYLKEPQITRQTDRLGSLMVWLRGLGVHR